jgi:hypothetical protein
MVLERLDILNLDQEHISWFGGLNLEGTREIVYLGQIYVFDVVGTVVVLDLAASPIHAFYLDRLSIFDSTAKWNCDLIVSIRAWPVSSRWTYRQDAICSEQKLAYVSFFYDLISYM